jgi:glycosyltransferase involved in cell wall biosynthesis
MNHPAGISLCMIVKNEARFLADALRSVAGVVDEVCIVDTGSTDGTLAIAREFGARIEQIGWNDDFSAARNAALALATRRWIFVLDADERLVPESRDALRAIGASPARDRGCWIACRNLADDFKGTGAMTNAIVRLFPNDRRIRYRNAIHEYITRDGIESGLPSDIAPIEIVHLGYLSEIVRERGKAQRNLRMAEAAVLAAPDDAFAHYNLGMSLLLDDRKDDAIAALERSREITRHSPRAFRVNTLVALADLYAKHRGDLALAQATIDDALAIAPTYSNAHFTHGRILTLRGDRQAAREAFGRAIGAGKHDHEQFVVDDEIAIWKAANEIGATLMVEQRYREALPWFERAGANRPRAVALLSNRAKCHEALGELDTAEALYAEAARCGEDEPSAIEWVNFCLRARPEAVALAAIETALPALGYAYRCTFLVAAAAVRLRAGDEPATAAYIKRALEAPPTPAEGKAIVTSLAGHLGEPGLLRFLERRDPATGASGLRIAYVPPL